MASFTVNNPPTDLTMNDFLVNTQMYSGLAKSCRFAARIVPIGEYIRQYGTISRDLSYLCEATEYPGRGLNNMTVRYYGPDMKLPFQSVYEDITMTFLCRTESYEREFFDDWMMYINPPNTFDFNYRDQYRSEIQIYQFGEVAEDDEDPIAEYMFTLHDAYPILVNPQPLTWADDQFLRLGVSFTYTRWTRSGRDPVPGPPSNGSSTYKLVPGTNIR